MSYRINLDSRTNIFRRLKVRTDQDNRDRKRETQERNANRMTERKTSRMTEGKTDRMTERNTDRMTDTEKETLTETMSYI